MGLAAEDASGLVEGGWISLNHVGLQVQGGSVLEEVNELPRAIESGKVLITRSTRVEDNEIGIGAGHIPLPTLADMFP